MSNKKPLKIVEHFSCLNDPRCSNRRHKLIDIITIAICAIICGCDGYDHIEEFGKAKYEWFKNFLDLPHGIPSHDTFERVFAALDPKEFQRSFISWVKSVSKKISGRFVHIDGKTVRGSYDKEAGKSAIQYDQCLGGGQRPCLGATENFILAGKEADHPTSSLLEPIVPY